MKRILFVCVENACRSQMAEGWARHLARRPLDIGSAGTRPSGQVDPTAIQVMAEVGVDISRHSSKAIAPEDLLGYDYVITMGCGAEGVCPVSFGGVTEDWGIPDPKGKPVEVYREVRATIRVKVARLLEEIARVEGEGR